MEKIITNTLTLAATPEKVWSLLTEPAYVKQYMYNSDLVTDWQPGQPVTFKGAYQGQEMVFVKGHVVENKPYSLLSYTVFDPNANYTDEPWNYLTVTYKLEAAGSGTQLTITQGDYSKVQDGEKRYDDSANAGGWSSILEKIRELV
jgi:uncharacterized protein YndB with AHSA1/START domain